jgi:CRP-like cAMP-binding protein
MADSNLLESLYVFQGIPVRWLDEMLRLSPVRAWQRGTTLFEEGESADVAVLLVTGELFATVGAGHNVRNVGTIRPGEVVGEQALFARKGRRNANVVAATDSVGLLLTEDVLVEGASNPAIVALERQLLGTMARRIRRADLEIKRAWREQGDAPEVQRASGFRESVRRIFGSWK